MTKQVVVVRDALEISVPVRGVLCFTGADWPTFAKPFEIDRVIIVWPRRLVKLISRAKDRGVPVSEVAECLADRLPVAVESPGEASAD